MEPLNWFIQSVWVTICGLVCFGLGYLIFTGF